MIIGLNCSKFNYVNKKKDAFFSIIDSKEKDFLNITKLTLPYQIDTQDFIVIGKKILVVNHTAYKMKTKKFYNVEIYNLNNLDKQTNIEKTKLPNEEFLKFPTCIAYNTKFLAIGIGGEKFRNKLFIYEFYNNDNFNLVKTINIDNKFRTSPSGLYFFQNFLVVSFYLSNEILIYDLNGYKLISHLYNGMFENPLSIYTLQNNLLVSSHLGNKIIAINNNKLVNVKIAKNSLNYPWGMAAEKGYIYIANLGLKNNKQPFVSKYNFANDKLLSLSLKEELFNEGINQLRVI